MKPLASLYAIVLFLCAFEAHAGDYEFSRAGNIVIEGQTSSAISDSFTTPFVSVFTIENVNTEYQDSSEQTDLAFDLRAHRFFTDRFSLGAEVYFSSLIHERSTSSSPSPSHVSGGGSWSLGLMFIAGYDLPIGKYFSYWPRVSIGVHHVFDGGSALGQYDESTSVFADLDASFCWHPMPHIALSAGPGMTIPIVFASESVFASGFTDSTGSTSYQLFESVSHGARTTVFHWLNVRFIAWF